MADFVLQAPPVTSFDNARSLSLPPLLRLGSTRPGDLTLAPPVNPRGLGDLSELNRRTSLSNLDSRLEKLRQTGAHADIELALYTLLRLVERAEATTSSDESDRRVTAAVDKAVTDKAAWRTICKELAGMFVLVPGLILFVCSGLGLVFGLLENVPWYTGFEYVLSITCGLATPLGSSNNFQPTSCLGMLLTGFIGLQTLAVVGILSELTENSSVLNIILACLSGAVRFDDRNSFVRRMLTTLVIAFVLASLLVTVFVVLFGAVLACAESWRWSDGSFYILSNVASLPNPLVPNTPVTACGIGFDAIMSAWCFVVGFTIIGIASSAEFPTCKECKEWFYSFSGWANQVDDEESDLELIGVNSAETK